MVREAASVPQQQGLSLEAHEKALLRLARTYAEMLDGSFEDDFTREQLVAAEIRLLTAARAYHLAASMREH